MIASARGRMRADGTYAAACYQAFFAGDDGVDAMAAGRQFATAVEYVIAFVKAHQKQ